MNASVKTAVNGALLAQKIRDIPDFPKPGIVFKDITPLLADPKALQLSVHAMADAFTHGKDKPDLVVGAEARGFIFGPAIASRLSAGFVPVRKPGKLPHKTRQVRYMLEYGSDTLEIHADAITRGKKCLMVDDLLATGGTMAACCELVEFLGGKIVGCSFLIELAFLAGRQKLSPYPIFSLIKYDKE